MGRTLIIGDVHGCAREMAELLDLLAPTSDDRIYFVGDLLSRGPDSRGVLRLYRQVGARSVRGNHEERLLAAHRARLVGKRRPRLSPHHFAVLRDLDDEDWALIDAMPLYLDLPEHDARILHAGVVPGIPFEEQDAWTFTHIRTVRDGVPSDRLDGKPWGESYGDTPHIIFGHNARRQLQLHPRATGIDTGCVYGRSLTALVLPEGEHLPFPQQRRELLVSVRAKAPYYRVS